jgi:hypothetical protein
VHARKDATEPDLDPQNASRAVTEYLVVLDDAAFGAATRGAPGRPFGRCGSITAQALSLNHSDPLMLPPVRHQRESEDLHQIK